MSSWLPSNFSQLTNQVASFTQNLVLESTDEVADPEAEMAVVKVRCRELELNCDDLKRELAEANNKSLELEERAETLELQLSAAKDAARMGMSEKDEQITALREAQQELAGQLRAALQDTATAAATPAPRSALMEEETVPSQWASAGREEELNSLRQCYEERLDGVRNQLEDTSEQLELLRAEHLALKADYQRLKPEYDRLKPEYERLKPEYERLKPEYDRLRAGLEMQTVKSESSVASVRTRNLQHKVSELQGQVGEYSGRLSELERLRAGWGEERSDLEMVIQRLHKQVEEVGELAESTVDGSDGSFSPMVEVDVVQAVAEEAQALATKPDQGVSAETSALISELNSRHFDDERALTAAREALSEAACREAALADQLAHTVQEHEEQRNRLSRIFSLLRPSHIRALKSLLTAHPNYTLLALPAPEDPGNDEATVGTQTVGEFVLSTSSERDECSPSPRDQETSSPRDPDILQADAASQSASMAELTHTAAQVTASTSQTGTQNVALVGEAGTQNVAQVGEAGTQSVVPNISHSAVQHVAVLSDTSTQSAEASLVDSVCMVETEAVDPAQVARLMVEIATLTQQLAASRESETALTTRLAELHTQLEAEFNRKQTELRTSYEKDRAELVSLLHQKHEESVRFYDQLQDTAAASATAEAQQATAVEQSRQLLARNEEELSRATAEVQRLRNHLVAMETDYTTAAMAAEQREDDLRRQLATALAHAEGASDAEAKRSADRLETAHLKSKLKKAEDTVSNLTTVLDSFRAEEESRIAAESGRLRRELEKSEKEVAKLKGRVEDLQQQVDEAEEDLCELRDTRDRLAAASATSVQLSEQVDRLTARLAQTETVMAKLKAEDQHKIDKQVMRELVTAYCQTPQRQKTEALALLCRVLDMDDAVVHASPARVGQALSSLFVQFLESESQKTLKLPADAMAEPRRPSVSTVPPPSPGLPTVSPPTASPPLTPAEQSTAVTDSSGVTDSPKTVSTPGTATPEPEPSQPASKQ